VNLYRGGRSFVFVPLVPPKQVGNIASFGKIRDKFYDINEALLKILEAQRSFGDVVLR
jgi:hypothetical protein